jgi:hypothetical protein
MIQLMKERLICAHHKCKENCEKCKPEYKWVECLEWTRHLGFFGRLNRKLNGLPTLPKFFSKEQLQEEAIK